MMPILLSISLAYLIGAIPTAVWVGKLFYKIDVREHGSGNAGATNTFRILGKIPGAFVLLFDVFKGWLALHNPAIIYFHLESNVDLQIALAVVAVLGHIFPVYAGFKGGKGIAILLGVVISLHPITALISLGVFLIIFLSLRYVSLGSIAASIAFPIILLVIEKDVALSHAIFAISVSLLSLITHKKNIRKILKGEENKITIWKKSNH
jgi:glycerol-3-phosphate acyltransferase PlsY